MALPKTQTHVYKNGGVKLDNNVDRVNYTIRELTRAALRDVGKYVVKQTKRNIFNRSGRLAKNTQYWVRKQECDLQVGFKPGGWYGGYQELGTEKQPKIGALTSAVEDNIAKIREIEAQYLSAIEEENKALSLIDEEETQE